MHPKKKTKKKKVVERVRRNHKQLFPVTSISRLEIAKLFNYALDLAGDEARVVNSFDGDDARLTDEVCRDIAYQIACALEPSEEL